MHVLELSLHEFLKFSVGIILKFCRRNLWNTLVNLFITSNKNTDIVAFVSRKLKKSYFFKALKPSIKSLWLWQWLVTYVGPNHFLDQPWLLTNWALRKITWIKINFSVKKMHSEMFSTIFCSLCSGRYVLLTHWGWMTHIYASVQYINIV